MTSIFAIVFSLVGPLYFGYRRELRYLQFFQQEDYTSKRFLAWYNERRAFDKKGTQTAAAALVFCLVLSNFEDVAALLTVLAAVWLVSIAWSEADPRSAGKIRLRLTARASRIFNLGFGLYAIALIAASLLPVMFAPHNLILPAFWLVQAVLIQSQPLWLVIANWFLEPYEENIQSGFADEARDLVAQYAPMVVGITGSYGKTSTKVILKEVLGAVSPTFSTPGSINSYMGITREIRERLKPQHHFAVIEMGAYYKGSIAKLCSLTPPKAAIITAVGMMHLERFGGQEAVYEAKSELAKAVPDDGILVCNGDYDYCRKMADEHRKKTTLLYGLDASKGQLDATIYDITASDKGSRFKIKWKGKEYYAFVGLLGKPMLSNVLASFTMACALGLAPELVIAALRNVKAESNRLEPMRAAISSLKVANNGHASIKPGQILRLNDAYNSNPIGFDSALDVLATISGKRKILVTPGMIELGEKQEEENKRATTKAASICDLVLVVGETNKKALVDGLHTGGLTNDRYKTFETMRAALSHLSEYCEDGDVVLIENDLPDLYEAEVVF